MTTRIVKGYTNGKPSSMVIEVDEEKECLEAEKAEAEYWRTVPYDEAVNTKIRERYTESQEFAILRQKDEKPTEYAEYYAYCEECKAYVKQKKTQYA